jgi:hypothetical protein
MRIARCKRPLQLHTSGNRGSAFITEGWQGDLDQVISVTPAGKHTLADALGSHLNEQNFSFGATQPASPKVNSAPRAQQE